MSATVTPTSASAAAGRVVPRELAAAYLHELAAALRPKVSAPSRRERLAGLLAVARHWSREEGP